MRDRKQECNERKAKSKNGLHGDPQFLVGETSKLFPLKPEVALGRDSVRMIL